MHVEPGVQWGSRDCFHPCYQYQHVEPGVRLGSCLQKVSVGRSANVFVLLMLRGCGTWCAIGLPGLFLCVLPAQACGTLCAWACGCTKFSCGALQMCLCCSCCMVEHVEPGVQLGCRDCFYACYQHKHLDPGLPLGSWDSLIARLC